MNTSVSTISFARNCGSDVSTRKGPKVRSTHEVGRPATVSDHTELGNPLLLRQEPQTDASPLFVVVE